MSNLDQKEVIETESQVVNETESQSQRKRPTFGGKKHEFKPGNQAAKGHVRLFGGLKPKIAVSHTVKFCRLAEKDLDSYYKRLRNLALDESLPAKTAIDAINVILKYALQMPSRQDIGVTPTLTVNVSNSSLVSAQDELEKIRKSRQNVIEIESKPDQNQT